MASGFGISGRGRCWPIWQDFLDCAREAKHPIQCKVYEEDYFECLHHRKEIDRNYQIVQAKIAGDKEERKSKKWSDL